jgi:hypothetical protein
MSFSLLLFLEIPWKQQGGESQTRNITSKESGRHLKLQPRAEQPKSVAIHRGPGLERRLLAAELRAANRGRSSKVRVALCKAKQQPLVCKDKAGVCGQRLSSQGRTRVLSLDLPPLPAGLLPNTAVPRLRECKHACVQELRPV